MEDKQEEVFTLKPEEERVFDKFASKALNGLLSDANRFPDYDSQKEKEILENLAKLSFKMAEAMILERRKTKKTSIPNYNTPALSQPK